ncbi:MAG: sugar kinase [Clostridia bacterium]|nr:sugar kinase [Clostridia bacterium]
MSKIVCFGEIMGRLNPEGYLRLRQARKLEISYCGGEANVAVSLANYGMDAKYVTKVPDNPLGQCAIDELRRFGVGTDDIVLGGERLGMYYVEKGASQRPSKVTYDRKYSSISAASREDFDWEKILDGAEWFHFTGITPALGENLPEICLDALKVCKAKGISVSCDLNFRKKLWSRERAKEVMSSLMPYVDVCIANEEDAYDVFGIKASDTDLTGGKLNKDGYKEVAKKLMDQFGFKKVAITLRTSLSATDNLWAGMLYDGTDYCFSKEYAIHIVDRVGGGDSFGGGLIYALMNGYSTQDAVEYAVAASCLKHTIELDFNMVSVDDVKALMGGDGSGRVQR